MKKAATFIVLFIVFSATANASDFETRVNRIFARPEFRHANFGIEFYSLDSKKPAYAHNAQLFFVPGSTTKLITCGSALQLFGPDYVFHTNVYRTGEILSDGTLQGDLVLVASGDPNLSGRIDKNGKLLFENEDHSYGGAESHGIGDPAAVLREFADQIAAKNIKRVTGRVLVDDSLFPSGEKELGTGVVIAPIVVNDNLVDIIIEPGEREGAAAVLKISPQTAYMTIINKITTGKPDARSKIGEESDIENSDGTRTITLTGTVSSGDPVGMASIPVVSPKRYAEVLFAEMLRERGIMANAALKEDKTDFNQMKSFYAANNLVAQHTSPPMADMIKVILKVSQNLHASMMPYLLSSLIAKKEAPQSGFDLIRDFLSKNVSDFSGASQSDGAGGSAHFTPDFMVHFLEAMTRNPAYQSYYDALPILGKDGTLFEIQVNSPAAGHVHAKTGTFADGDMLNRSVFVTGKGLAGYVTTRSGHKLAFAIYINNVIVPDQPNAIRDLVGQAAGEIAAIGYETL